jgi:hypothetical protein
MSTVHEFEHKTIEKSRQCELWSANEFSQWSQRKGFP